MSKSKRRHVIQRPQQTKSLQSTLERALAVNQQGQLEQAEVFYRTILKQAPNHFDALHLLGVIEAQRKNFEAAVLLIGQALKLNAMSAPAHANIGHALRNLKRHEEALASC